MNKDKSHSKWADLEDHNNEELKKLIRQKKDFLKSLNSEMGELRDERKNQVMIVKQQRPVRSDGQ